MKKNLQHTNRLIRLLVSAIILGVYVSDFYSGVISKTFILIGTYLVATSIMSFCPIVYLMTLTQVKKLLKRKKK